MLRLTLAAAAGLAALALVLTVPFTRGDEPKPAGDAGFAGKVVALTVADADNGVYLENARVRTIGPRTYIVGTYAKQVSDEELPEMTYWVPLEEVILVTEFKSVEDAKKAFAARQRQADK